MELRRWTPLTLLFPRRYVSRDPFWAEFDFEAWSGTEYEWRQDAWNGFRDFASRPEETVSRGEGDCEDYALVAMSWAVAQGREGVGIAFCLESNRPWPTHVVAFDDRRVYSSGHIYRADVDGWVADSKYAFALKRRVA